MMKKAKKTTKASRQTPAEQARRHYAELGAAAAAQEKKLRETYINRPSGDGIPNAFMALLPEFERQVAVEDKARMLHAALARHDALFMERLKAALTSEKGSTASPEQKAEFQAIDDRMDKRTLDRAGIAGPFTCPECTADIWPKWGMPMPHRLYLQRLEVITSACPVCGHKAAYYEWKKYQTRPVEWRPKIHWLKILPRYFYALSTRRKSFELRFNDRDYRVGDNVIFQMWSPAQGMHGRTLPMTITYITDYPEGLRPGYVVLGVKPL